MGADIDCGALCKRVEDVRTARRSSAGPLVTPPPTALLLDHVLAEQTGTGSGAFSPSRQIGGALASRSPGTARGREL
ncbi:hypothetical protein [Streptomyces endophyticus]|uniref:Uncharacterized protein n=1 Tax=Streptomyces endophyticus TaxID=714166 RepID=A0ABU6F2B6_9ACTN|nr:hypothetical protein [Streptomyces endophyticus]MEB8338138.1 hypothetical protein [Streptomyces endophyticus]